jgi:hypothetical protein
MNVTFKPTELLRSIPESVFVTIVIKPVDGTWKITRRDAMARRIDAQPSAHERIAAAETLSVIEGGIVEHLENTLPAATPLRGIEISVTLTSREEHGHGGKFGKFIFFAEIGAFLMGSSHPLQNDKELLRRLELARKIAEARLIPEERPGDPLWIADGYREGKRMAKHHMSVKAGDFETALRALHHRIHLVRTLTRNKADDEEIRLDNLRPADEAGLLLDLRRGIAIAEGKRTARKTR